MEKQPQLTIELLRHIAPHAPKNADVFIAHLVRTMADYEINTDLRRAMFLAQLAHESGEFRYVRELANGKAYELRKDLGNVEKGDGMKYKGRGLIQITGKANYMKVGKALFDDEQYLLKTPSLLETPQYACLSAGWYWNDRHLNPLADKKDIVTVTQKINGGKNGLESRMNYYTRACQAFSC